MTTFVNVRLRSGRVVHRATVLSDGQLLTHCGYYTVADQQTGDDADCGSCAERRERIEAAQ